MSKGSLTGEAHRPTDLGMGLAGPSCQRLVLIFGVKSWIIVLKPFLVESFTDDQNYFTCYVSFCPIEWLNLPACKYSPRLMEFIILKLLNLW